LHPAIAVEKIRLVKIRVEGTSTMSCTVAWNGSPRTFTLTEVSSENERGTASCSEMEFECSRKRERWKYGHVFQGRADLQMDLLNMTCILHLQNRRGRRDISKGD
jgi:hypothetical protein